MKIKFYHAHILLLILTSLFLIYTILVHGFYASLILLFPMLVLAYRAWEAREDEGRKQRKDEEQR